MAQLMLAFYPDAPPAGAEQRGNLYRQALEDLSDSQWSQAVRTAVETLKFFPKISELRGFGETQPTWEKEREARVQREISHASDWYWHRYQEQFGKVDVVNPGDAMSVTAWCDRAKWDSWEQCQYVEATVARNPKRSSEGSLAYLERIALTSGLLKEPMMLDWPELTRDPGQEG